MPYAVSPQSDNDYRWEYYWKGNKYADSQAFHEEGKILCRQKRDHSDSFAWFSAFENHLAEIHTSRKESEAYKAFIKAVYFLTESLDPYTARHQEKVSELAWGIAREMGLPDDMIEGIRVSGMVHDMGKMSVPAEVVNKPAALTPFEYLIIKEHPQKAYAILKDIQFPWPIAETVLQHHERLDGSGYPGRLKGNEIRLEARVLAVADVVEAISSRRPYRSGLGIEAALKEIDKNKGVCYDIDVVAACERSLKTKSFLMCNQ